MQNMDCMDIDPLVDVPDTPDRLASQRKTSSAVGVNPVNRNSQDKKVVNGIRSNRRLINHRNSKLTHSDHWRDCHSYSEFKPGISIFASASDGVSTSNFSQKSMRLADRVSKKPETNPFELNRCSEVVPDQKKIPSYIPLNSHSSSSQMVDRVKSGGGSSDVANIATSSVKIEDETRGNVVDLSKKFPSSVLYRTGGRDKMQVFSGHESSSLRKDHDAEIPPRCLTIQDDDHVMDVDAMHDYSGKCERAFTSSKNHVPREICMGLSSAGVSVRGSQSSVHVSEGLFSLHNDASSGEASSNAHKREIDGTFNKNSKIANNVAGLISRDKGKEIDLSSDSQPKTEQAASMPLWTGTSPKKIGQRRLVRNGCISPCNIAKSKIASDSYCKNPTKNKQDESGKIARNAPSDGMSSREIHIISPGSEDNQMDRMKGKGKGITDDATLANEFNAGTSSPRRNLLVSRVDETDTRSTLVDLSKSGEELGSWRSTRNRSKLSLHGLIHLSTRDSGVSMSSSQNHESRREDRDDVMLVNDGLVNNFHGLEDPVSLQHAGPNPCQVQSSSGIVPELQLANDRNRGKQKLMKRQRKSPSASNHIGECSTLASDDSDVSYLVSSGQPPNLRQARTRNSQRHVILKPVIEVDEYRSPETRNNNSQGASSCEANARDKQVEADEILARQLQEQFYRELPGTRVREVDASIAWALQHEEHARHYPFLRDSSAGNPYRNSQSLSSRNSSARSTSRVRASNSARMSQLRRSLHGRPPVASSRGRSFLFPANMDAETRMDLLEALEAAAGNHNGVTARNPFFQTQRDFNENDYEMLLALDENNDQHVGASVNQINSLPQSTVQTDNFEEACAICLETPSSGDTIRHLPCLHKFHKECIDPWLQRKTSCPICKSSIR